MGIFAAIYHWFPKFTGRMPYEGLGKLHFVLTFLGANLNFLPMHPLGLMGMPRRVSSYDPEFAFWNVLASLGALAVIGAFAFPGKSLSIESSPWLPLHWALGIASYGMFAAAVVHAGLMSHAERQIRLAHEGASGLPLLTLERLTFRFVNVGFILLSATLLAGFFFSETLYGSAGANWKWDHKTIFSLMAWFTFALLLMGRSRLGWRGKRAVRMLYIGSGLLLLAYVGSRFVLEVLLERSSG
jgi:ABC-type uncharacterized transport system permease subunit